MLLAGDGLILYLALMLALFLRYPVAELGLVWHQHWLPISVIFGFWLVLLYSNGLYDMRYAKPSLALFQRFAGTWLLSMGVAIALFYLLPAFIITPKTNLFIIAGLYAALFVGWRATAAMFLGQATKTKVLVIQPGEEMLSLLNNLQDSPQLGYEVVGIINSTRQLPENKIRSFSPETPLRALVNEHHINLVVASKQDSSRLHEELYELLFWEVRVINSENFFESLTGRIPLEALTETWFFENLQSERAILYDTSHRVLDYIISILTLSVLGILLPILIPLIKLSSPGPLFYRQQRVGRNGQRFAIFKLRTMRAVNKDGGAEVAGAQMTTENDSRVTLVGKIIRQLRLDELPQAWNVIRGDMSLIGPRPERPEFIYELERALPYFAVRHLVKPGITGWAQVNYPYAATTAEQMVKFQYDLYYIKNRSYLLDLAIFLKTFHVLLYGKGR